jgi:diguanylate cyclase (GGDEF)-like protein
LLRRRLFTPHGTAAFFAGVTAVWLVGNLLGSWNAPAIGWLGPIVSVFLCAHACWRLVFLPTLAPAVRRFWRVLAVAITLESVGAVSNIRDALGGPDAPTQRLGPVTLTLYMAAVFAVQWGLLRLPTGTGQRMRWAQFLLDSGTVTVMAAVFGWHFSFRNSEQWIKLSGSVWAPLIVIVLGFTLIVTVMKLATSGVGAIDRGVLRFLALALGTSSLAGTAAPFFMGHPYITDAHLSVPTAAVCILFAVRRQEQVAGQAPPPPAPPRRGVNLVPYAAAAAVNGLLLVAGRGEDGAVIIAATVAVTTIVVARQIVAFRDNQRLLKALDDTVLDLSAARDQLANQASHDELTGLGNRRLLHEKVDEALAGLPPRSVHLALIDLDDFKTVNDRLGHLVGDGLLQAVADRLDAVAGSAATLVRLGGDEFALLFAPMATEEADAAVARIAEAMQTPLRVAGDDLVMHASIGLADAGHPEARRSDNRVASAPKVDARELLRRADVAMYTAKDLGKDRYARYEPSMDRDAAQDAALIAQLRHAIDRAELYLVYQPIVQLGDGAIVGAEALVRWSHPERGFVPPHMFIPAAERSGLIIPLGDWILREACRQAAVWDAELGKVSVNVSARQLREPEFVGRVANVLAETGLASSRLTIEVTETAVFDDGAALDSVRALHALGLTIALDDFGTGHSSLGLLRTCPVDVLKVDKSFVDSVGTDSDQTVIATSLIQIADGLRLQAIAEGVETAEQAAELLRLGYRYAQGYHFGRPMPAKSLTERLSTASNALTNVPSEV